MNGSRSPGRPYCGEGRSAVEGVPMRDKWEYKMLVGSGVPPHWKDADDATDYGRSLETEILNRLGQDGWEVCAFDVSLAGRTLILKRKLV